MNGSHLHLSSDSARHHFLPSFTPLLRCRMQSYTVGGDFSPAPCFPSSSPIPDPFCISSTSHAQSRRVKRLLRHTTPNLIGFETTLVQALQVRFRTSGEPRPAQPISEPQLIPEPNRGAGDTPESDESASLGLLTIKWAPFKTMNSFVAHRSRLRGGRAKPYPSYPPRQRLAPVSPVPVQPPDAPAHAGQSAEMSPSTTPAQRHI